jgi:hypothetical protein
VHCHWGLATSCSLKLMSVVMNVRGRVREADSVSLLNRAEWDDIGIRCGSVIQSC